MTVLSNRTVVNRRLQVVVNRRLQIVAAVSAIYDGLVGVVMLVGRPLLAQIFGVALPEPPIHADLNGVFLLAVAAGYLIPYRDPDSAAGRTYMWVMGPSLKGAGAIAFILDRVIRHSPVSFLLFAASDGTLALLTWWALMNKPRGEKLPVPSRGTAL